jgi:uncharacterized delta-60 repeat protein
MNYMKNLLFALLLIVTGNLAAQSMPGDPDSTFNGTGRVILDNGYLDLYQDVKIMADGKIVAVGTTYDAVYAADMQVTRLLNDGTYDPAFGTNGVFRYHLGYETGGYACQVKDNGSILVAGISMDDFGGFAMLLLQITDKGELDTTFGEDGIAYYDYGPGEDIAYALALQEDDKILLAGHITNDDFRHVPAVVRFTEEGLVDSTFGEDGLATIPVTETDNEFAGVQVQPDGKIVAAGHISNGLSWFSLLMARFDENGVPDATFGTDGIINMDIGNVDDEFFDLRLTSSGDIIATGFTTTQGDFNFHLLVMKFDENGDLVPEFGEEGMVIWGETSYNVGYAMEILPDDKIVVAGSSGEKAPMDSDWGIWKFNSDGSFDETFGNNGIVTTDATGEFDEALGIAVQEDGKLVAAGKFRMENNINFGVIRYQNELTVSVSEVTEKHVVTVMPNPVRSDGNINIAMELNESQSISIEILNMAGSVVMERSPGHQPEGMFMDSYGLDSELSAGIYFIRVTGSKSAFMTRKVMVIE